MACSELVQYVPECMTQSITPGVIAGPATAGSGRIGGATPAAGDAAALAAEEEANQEEKEADVGMGFSLFDSSPTSALGLWATYQLFPESGFGRLDPQPKYQGFGHDHIPNALVHLPSSKSPHCSVRSKIWHISWCFQLADIGPNVCGNESLRYACLMHVDDCSSSSHTSQASSIGHVTLHSKKVLKLRNVGAMGVDKPHLIHCRHLNLLIGAGPGLGFQGHFGTEREQLSQACASAISFFVYTVYR